eukprot:53911_1
MSTMSTISIVKLAIILLISSSSFKCCAAQDPFCSRGVAKSGLCFKTSCSKICGSGCIGSCCCGIVRGRDKSCVLYDAPCVMPEISDMNDIYSCGDTISGITSGMGFTYYFRFMMNDTYLVNFDSCNGIQADVVVSILDDKYVDISSDLYCKSKFNNFPNISFAPGGWCGTCNNFYDDLDYLYLPYTLNYTYPENFTVPFMEPNTMYTIKITEVPNYVIGLYEIKIQCELHSIPECSASTLQNKTQTNDEHYPALYCDNLNTLYDWERNGNLSLSDYNVSSNCPSISSSNDANISKICISNSAFWDGQYMFKSHDDNSGSSIYYNAHVNKYMYEYITQSDYLYYLTDYETDSLMKTRCVVSKTELLGVDFDIRDCIGKWEYYENAKWELDINMVSTSCNDLCMNGFWDTSIPDDSTFIWVGYNDTMRTDIYYCEDCIDCYYGLNGAYLSGTSWYENGTDYYGWMLCTEPEDCLTRRGYGLCLEGIDLSDNYIFRLSRCASDWWYNLYFDDFVDGLTVTECMSQKNEALHMHSDEFKICVSESNVAYLDGEYLWQDYNSKLHGSIYYNMKKNIYIYPSVSDSGQYQYHIHGDDILYARCGAKNADELISHCIGKWETYYNNSWVVDTNMISTPCQDICITSELFWWFNYGSFQYSHFNRDENANVYFCEQCSVSGLNLTFNGTYLYGITIYNNYDPLSVCSQSLSVTQSYICASEQEIFSKSNVSWWVIGPNPNSYGVWAKCQVTSLTDSDYVGNIDDCLQEIWTDSVSIDYYDDPVIMSKCNVEISESCVELGAQSELSRTYFINGSFKDFAIGFDINLKSVYGLQNQFIIEYGCNNNDTYE